MQPPASVFRDAYAHGEGARPSRRGRKTFEPPYPRVEMGAHGTDRIQPNRLGDEAAEEHLVVKDDGPPAVWTYV
jgi:hypothetical protein